MGSAIDFLGLEYIEFRCFNGKLAYGLRKRPRSRDRKMGCQGCVIRPFFDEDKPGRVLSVLVYCVRDATILLSGSPYMLHAQRECVSKPTFLYNEASSNDDHRLGASC